MPAHLDTAPQKGYCMNIYVFQGNPSEIAYGTATVLAHTADEARKLLAANTSDAEKCRLERTIQLGRNPKAQVIASYFE